MEDCNCNGRDLDKKRSSIQTVKYAYFRRRSTAVYQRRWLVAGPQLAHTCLDSLWARTSHAVESLHRAVGTVGARPVVPAASAALVRVGAGRRPRTTGDDRAATGPGPPNRERGKRAVAAPRAAVTLVRLAEINAAGKICAAARRRYACRKATRSQA
jgi:hypothetical protein